MEEAVKAGTEYIALFMEVFAGLVIAAGAVKAVIGYLRSGNLKMSESIRWKFGHTIVFALEFLLAADILTTAVAPTWDEIGQLSAIAVLRTGLNYFLDKELQRLGKSQELRS